jgi:hypothetical protein
LAAGCASDGASAPPTSSAPPTTVEITTIPVSSAPETVVSSTQAAAADVPTTVAGPRSLPLSLVPAGTYRIAKFVVPFDITTEGDWKNFHSAAESLILFRGSAGTNPTSGFYVTSGLVDGSSPQEVIDAFCGGKIEFVGSSTTSLLGQPALQREGVAANDCNWGFVEATGQLTVAPGSTVRLVAAAVDGQVVLVVADGPTVDWTALSSEVGSMIDSMTPVA